jgi:hypothetical protein
VKQTLSCKKIDFVEFDPADHNPFDQVAEIHHAHPSWEWVQIQSLDFQVQGHLVGLQQGSFYLPRN